ncbi:hypothetical protein ACTFIW_003741 [Dictyostelium discoideum]
MSMKTTIASFQNFRFISLKESREPQPGVFDSCAGKSSLYGSAADPCPCTDLVSASDGLCPFLNPYLYPSLPGASDIHHIIFQTLQTEFPNRKESRAREFPKKFGITHIPFPN